MTDQERELKERDLFGRARLLLKELRMKEEAGVIVKGGRAVYIGPDASEEERRNTIGGKSTAAV